MKKKKKLLFADQIPFEEKKEAFLMQRPELICDLVSHGRT